MSYILRTVAPITHRLTSFFKVFHIISFLLYRIAKKSSKFFIKSVILTVTRYISIREFIFSKADKQTEKRQRSVDIVGVFYDKLRYCHARKRDKS